MDFVTLDPKNLLQPFNYRYSSHCCQAYHPKQNQAAKNLLNVTVIYKCSSVPDDIALLVVIDVVVLVIVVVPVAFFVFAANDYSVVVEVFRDAATAAATSVRIAAVAAIAASDRIGKGA